MTAVVFPVVAEDTMLELEDILEAAQILTGAGRYEDALTALNWAFQEPGEKPASLLLARGLALGGAGALQQAIGDLHTAANMDPNNGFLLINLALLLLRANRIGDARTILSRILAHCPDYHADAAALQARLDDAVAQWGEPAA